MCSIKSDLLHLHDGRVCSMLVAQESSSQTRGSLVFWLYLSRVRGLRATSSKSSATVKIIVIPMNPHWYIHPVVFKFLVCFFLSFCCTLLFIFFYKNCPINDSVVIHTHLLTLNRTNEIFKYKDIYQIVRNKCSKSVKALL